MNKQPHPISAATFTASPFFNQFPRWLGLLIATFGLLVDISWWLHWQRISQLLPNTAPMQFNTALCFILSGLALFFLTISRPKISVWLSTVSGILAALTLLEYLSGWNLNIDQIFCKPFYAAAATAYPGRMSPLVAVSFIFTGIAVILAGANRSWTHRLAGTGLLACMVVVIAAVAILGYLFGVEAAYGWGAYSRMAINTAIMLLILNTGLLIWAGKTARRENYNFLRWLPITGSVTLMIMVAFVSYENATMLNKETQSREHSIQVIFSAHSFLDNLIDIQRGTRGYVTVGDTNALAAYFSSSQLEQQQLDELAGLVQDNPAQRKRLDDLKAAMKGVFGYDNEVIEIYRQHGFAAVSKTDTSGENRAVFGRARDILREFSQAEQGALTGRDLVEREDYHNSTRLLIFGSVTAALLLVIGNLMASHEMNLRRRAEDKLTETLRLQNAILNSAKYAIISLDTHGVVKTFNPAAEQMIGYAASEIIGNTTPLMWRDPGEIAERSKQLSVELNRPINSDLETLLLRAKAGISEEYEVTFIHKNGHRFPVLVSHVPLADSSGTVTGFLGIIANISERKQRETEREKLIGELQQALAEVKTLSGLIPICGWCKSVRSDQGFWHTVEDYVRSHTDATFSHGMCPSCAEKFKAEILNVKADG